MTRTPPIDTLRLSLGILQPSPFCNIQCKYCYLPETSTTPRMSMETVAQAARFLVRRPGLLDDGAVLVFHCGEPLAVPLRFYREAFAIVDGLNPEPRPIEAAFSTNATLIDQAWCDFIRARGSIRIRVSIDGPAWLHDRNRVTRAGRGTFDRVMAGIDLLRANGIPFDVLCVLTEPSLHVPEELWRFFRGIDARSVGFCVEDTLGPHTVNSLAFGQARDLVRSFFGTWIRLREHEAPTFRVRELDDILLLAAQPRTDPFVRPDNLPLCVITIGWDGGITVFSPELRDVRSPRYTDFIVGNVATDSMESILASEKFQRIYADIDEGVRRCRASCRYYRACGGGFPVSKLTENGTFVSTETLSCRLRTMAVADAVLDHLAEQRDRAIRASVAACLSAGRLA